MPSKPLTLELPIYLRIPSYGVVFGALAGFAWLALIGSPAFPLWVALLVWFLVTAPFVVAATQWISTVALTEGGISIATPMLGTKTISWAEASVVKLKVTSHARDDRFIVVQTKGGLAKRITYSSCRSCFREATKQLVELAERHQILVKVGHFNTREEWNTYLGIAATVAESVGATRPSGGS